MDECMYSSWAWNHWSSRRPKLRIVMDVVRCLTKTTVVAVAPGKHLPCVDELDVHIVVVVVAGIAVVAVVAEQ